MSASGDRRGFFSTLSGLAMGAGLIGGYGLFAYIAARFLYPARARQRQWMFVARTDTLAVGNSLLYQAPSGETVNVTRRAASGEATDFIALSSTCPHLGCQVHWEAAHDRYFCPCHSGIFTALGEGIGGPPGEAGLSLPRYELKVESDLLFIEVAVTSLAAGRQGKVIERVAGIHAAGHDPCLHARCPTDS